MHRALLIGAGAIASIALVATVGRVTDGPTEMETRSSEIATFFRSDGVDVRGAYCEIGRCWITLASGQVRVVHTTEYEDGSYTISQGDMP